MLDNNERTGTRKTKRSQYLKRSWGSCSDRKRSQLEEWHVILSCDQLAETLRAAPTLPFKMVITFVWLVSVLLLLSSMAILYHVNYSLQRAYCKLCMGFTCTCCSRILSWAEIFHSSSYYYSLSGSFVTFFIVVRKVIKSLNNSFCSNWNAKL